MLIDTHCHLDFDRFDRDREDVIARAEDAGVINMIIPALDLTNIPAVLNLCDRYPGLYAAVGIHPNSTADWQPHWLDQIRSAAAHPKVVAVGEIGLDYYWDDSPMTVQHEALTAQLALAAELNLPVILHNREASDDLLSLLAASPLAGREAPGVLHSFSADLVTAEEALAMGYYIGITGPVTFKKADELRHIVARLPLERILVETDAPFLAPQPWRGKRNEPAFVRFIAKQIATIHNLSEEEIGGITTANARRLFPVESVQDGEGHV